MLWQKIKNIRWWKLPTLLYQENSWRDRISLWRKIWYFSDKVENTKSIYAGKNEAGEPLKIRVTPEQLLEGVPDCFGLYPDLDVPACQMCAVNKQCIEKYEEALNEKE
jgi:hypothetical protein